MSRTNSTSFATTINTRFFIDSPSEANSPELYQVLLRSVARCQGLGNQLVSLAEQAHASRQYDQLREAALLLSNLPLNNYQAVGTYFSGVAAYKLGRGDRQQARSLFERAVDTAPDTYKVKGILSLAAVSFDRGDFDSALYYYRETLRASKLATESLEAVRGMAIVRSIEGSHRQAVEDLEKVLPVIKYAPPHIYFDLLNSYAVELGEVGRLEEARRVAEIAVRSPFAHVYPEWRETYKEITAKLRPVSPYVGGISWLPESSGSAALPSFAADNVVALPLAARRPQPPLSQPGRVIAYHGWQQTSPQPSPYRQEVFTPNDLKQMTIADKQAALLTVLYSDDVTHDMLDPLLIAAGKVTTDTPTS